MTRQVIKLLITKLCSLILNYFLNVKRELTTLSWLKMIFIHDSEIFQHNKQKKKNQVNCIYCCESNFERVDYASWVIPRLRADVRSTPLAK